MPYRTMHQDDEQVIAEDHGTAAGSRTSPTITSPATAITIDLDAIVERDSYTRTLRQDHVKEIMASIAVVGLEQPVVLITGNQLVAGRHRYHALMMLRDQKPERFAELFPAGVAAMLYDLGEHPAPVTILALELSENALRRDYTPEDRERLLNNLLGQGYLLKRGRPAAGERPLVPMLMDLLGASRATVNRLLASIRPGGKVSSDTIPGPRDRSRAADVSSPVDGDDLAPTQALEPRSQPEPLKAARDAVRRLSAEELDQFRKWFTGHLESNRVPVQDEDEE